MWDPAAKSFQALYISLAVLTPVLIIVSVLGTTTAHAVSSLASHFCFHDGMLLCAPSVASIIVKRSLKQLTITLSTTLTKDGSDRNLFGSGDHLPAHQRSRTTSTDEIEKGTAMIRKIVKKDKKAGKKKTVEKVLRKTPLGVAVNILRGLQNTMDEGEAVPQLVYNWRN